MPEAHNNPPATIGRDDAIRSIAEVVLQLVESRVRSRGSELPSERLAISVLRRISDSEGFTDD